MSDSNESPWPRLFGIVIIWSIVAYLVVNDHLDSYDIGDYFFTGLFLVVALLASLAVWWGMSADIRIQIGHHNSPASPSGLGKGFVLGGLTVLILGLCLAVPSVKRIQELDKRLSELTRRRTEMIHTPILVARTDLDKGHMLVNRDIRAVYAPGLQFNSQLFTSHNINELLGSTVKEKLLAGTPLVRPLISLPGDSRDTSTP